VGIRILPLTFLAALFVIAGFAPGAAQTDQQVRVLDVGHSVFWDGEPVTVSGPDDWNEATLLAQLGSRACSTGYPKVLCFTDYLEVPEGTASAELRVAVEHPSAADIPASQFGPTPSMEQFALAVISPNDVEHSHSGMNVPVPGNVVYTPEIRVANPVPGRWRVITIAIRVRNPDYATRPAYRARAGLFQVSPTSASPQRRALLPNLQANPAFELVFAACDTPGAAANNRCIRFAQGPVNVGEGPLDLEVVPPPEVNPFGNPSGENIVRADEYQYIYYSDGTMERRLVGEAGFHTDPGHLHYHHQATGGYELLAADPQTQTLRPVAPGTKIGFCMGDYLMARWRSFNQAPQRTNADLLLTSHCGVPDPVTARFGLSPGWGDVYFPGLPGNALAFGDNPDGNYVIRAVTNPCAQDPAGTSADCKGTIVERDYTDNVAYTYFRVEGTGTTDPKIIPIERGLGLGPFDPAREPTDDYRLFLHPPLDPTGL
jgi:hypothetical protein